MKSHDQKSCAYKIDQKMGALCGQIVELAHATPDFYGLGS